MAMINTNPALQAQQAVAALHVPVNMYMNPTIPPNYYQNGQAQGACPEK